MKNKYSFHKKKKRKLIQKKGGKKKKKKKERRKQDRDVNETLLVLSCGGES